MDLQALELLLTFTTWLGLCIGSFLNVVIPCPPVERARKVPSARREGGRSLRAFVASPRPTPPHCLNIHLPVPPYHAAAWPARPPQAPISPRGRDPYRLCFGSSTWRCSGSFAAVVLVALAGIDRGHHAAARRTLLLLCGVGGSALGWSDLRLTDEVCLSAYCSLWCIWTGSSTHDVRGLPRPAVPASRPGRAHRRATS